MDDNLFAILAKLRILVGFLGERDQFGWWQSSFLSSSSSSFLSPLFTRTQTLAQCNSVSQAASLMHDKYIGVGNVYHLFRLPEYYEQKIQQALHTLDSSNIISDKQSVLLLLKGQGLHPSETNVGPFRVGNKKSLSDISSWGTVAGLYAFAFENSIVVYPYFSDIL